MIKRNNRKNISEMINRRHLMKKEAFKPTDNLSPSETAAVVSNWTHNAFNDSWKDEVGDGEIFHGEIKDTFAPMEVYVDKRNKMVSVYYLGLNDDDIKSYVQLGLKSGKEPDEAFMEDINNALSEDFSNEHAMAYKDVNMPLTQIELEKLLDSCKEEVLQDYNKLESAFYRAVEGVMESKKNSRRKALKEASVQSFTDWEYPVLKDVMSTFKDDIQWALSRALYSMKSNLPRLESDNESEVLRALADILDKADDMNQVKKALKRTSLGQRMW